MPVRAFSIALLLTPLVAAGGAARAQPPDYQARRLERDVSVDEKLGQRLPFEARFRDQAGRAVTLGQLFDRRRPVVLNFAYHRCKVLCNMVLNATIDGLKGIDWTLGEQYSLISISIDPRDTPESAASKSTQLAARYGRADERAQGITFLTGDEATIRRVADAAGFRYFYDERADQYGHAAVLMLTTPDGRMARYLYGLQFKPRDVQLGLYEAARGRTLSTLERVIIYCYRYDPNGGGYALAAGRIMKTGGALTAVGLAAFLFVLWRRELRRRGHHARTGDVVSRGGGS